MEKKYLKDSLLKTTPTTNPKHTPNQILFFKDVEYIMFTVLNSQQKNILN